MTQTKISQALIMAAGRGSRMMPLTSEIPKAMAKYKDTTLVANSIKKLKKKDLRLHITVGYKGAELAKHVIEHDVASIFNTEGRGNAWWIFNTPMKYVDEAIIVLTCDNIVDLNVDSLFSDYLSLNRPHCMLVPVKPVEGLEGDYIERNQNLVLSLDRNKPSNLYCSGIQILNPAMINRDCQETEDFNVLWTQLVTKGHLYCGSTYLQNWFTVDTVNQLHEVNKGK